MQFDPDFIFKKLRYIQLPSQRFNKFVIVFLLRRLYPNGSIFRSQTIKAMSNKL